MRHLQEVTVYLLINADTAEVAKERTTGKKAALSNIVRDSVDSAVVCEWGSITSVYMCAGQ